MSLDEIEAEFVAATTRITTWRGCIPAISRCTARSPSRLRRLERHGIPYTLTPGVPAFAAAAAALGRELTMPEVAQSVVLTRMPGRASAMPQGETLAAFAATGATLAIHLAIQSIATIVAELSPFYGADCPVAVVVRASWPDERILRGTLGTIMRRSSPPNRSSARRSSWSAARWRRMISAKARLRSGLSATVSRRMIVTICDSALPA